MENINKQQTIKEICNKFNGLKQEDIERRMKIAIGKDCMLITKNL